MPERIADTGCASSRSSSQAEESSLITTNSTEITETAAVINQPANTANSENTSAHSNTTTKVTVGTEIGKLMKILSNLGLFCLAWHRKGLKQNLEN